MIVARVLVAAALGMSMTAFAGDAIEAGEALSEAELAKKQPILVEIHDDGKAVAYRSEALTVEFANDLRTTESVEEAREKIKSMGLQVASAENIDKSVNFKANPNLANEAVGRPAWWYTYYGWNVYSYYNYYSYYYYVPVVYTYYYYNTVRWVYYW